MQKFYSWVVKNPKKILVFFFMLAVCGALLQNLVEVNYDMADYLPEDTRSTVSIDLMNEEFDGGIPNARVMVKNVALAEALEYKQKLENCEGVEDVIWLDDTVSIYEPLEMADTDTVETYYKDNNALFTVTVDENDLVNRIDKVVLVHCNSE